MTRSSLLLAALFSTTALSAAPGFKITGKVAGGEEGMKVYLKYADVPYQQRKSIDSAVLHNGQFAFTGEAASPRYCVVQFRDAKNHPAEVYEDKILHLFVENGNIKVSAVYDSLDVEFYGEQKPGAVKVSGSKSNDAFQAYEKEQKALRGRYSELFNEYIKIVNDKEDTSTESRYHKGIPVTNKLDATAAELNGFNMHFIRHHAPDEVNAFIATDALRSGEITTTQVDSLIKYFSTATSKGFLVNRFLEAAPGFQRTAIGSSFVDMSFADSSGQMHALRDYIGKGKYVMLECWA